MFFQKRLIFLLVLLICALLTNRDILANDRNIFGLHLTQPQDLNTAAPIINSSGADWGWATIVIRADQLDHNTWQSFFDNCRKLHIIPIVRIATHIDMTGWQKPQFEDIDQMAAFLNSLNWPTQKQHVILFNEINHSTEWGGGVDVKNYTDIAVYAAQKFKSLNPNFFILGAALDLAAPEKPPFYKSAPNVYKEIFNHNPKYFELMDGLASHSYPNHGFVGKPQDTGQHSIKGYLWEQSYLNSLGVAKTFPVYITETGWPHREGDQKNNRFYSLDTCVSFLKTALQFWSKDFQVKAVTPFTYNYPHPPFEHFSWLDKQEKLFPSYQQILDLPKEKNHPSQITRYAVSNIKLPFLILSNTDLTGRITLKNIGQSVWGETQFCLTPQTTQNITLDAICTGNDLVFPGSSQTFNFKFKIIHSESHSGKTYISWSNLPPFEIVPINDSSSIYRPKLGLKEKLSAVISNLLSAILSKN